MLEMILSLYITKDFKSSLTDLNICNVSEEVMTPIIYVNKQENPFRLNKYTGKICPQPCMANKYT